MKHLTSRSYECGKDLQSILDLTTRVRPPQHRNDYPGRLDIEEAIASVIVRKNTRLWFDDSCPIAWACVDKFNNLLWELDYQYAGNWAQKLWDGGRSASEGIPPIREPVLWMQIVAMTIRKELRS
jgi:hypothetical protein